MVGAGVAGLTCAKVLASQGVEAVVFESSDRIGGRIYTVNLDGFVFDAGASSIAPVNGPLLEMFEGSEPPNGLVRIIKPLFEHDGKRVFEGKFSKNNLRRFTFEKGNCSLAKHLADGLSIELNSQIDDIQLKDNSYRICDQEFDALVLAIPATESARLLEALGEKRPLENVRYRPCLVALLGFEGSLDLPYHALLSSDSGHPMNWVSFESLKCKHRAPAGHTAVIVQLGMRYSKWRFDSTDETIINDTLVDLRRIVRHEFSTPVVQSVVRWPQSQPETNAKFERVNTPGTSLVIAGDGVMGSRVEHAYESGLKAAHLLLDR